MRRPPLVITIQSQVVMGHVGNSAAVFPMLAAGLEVAALPTVLFSNTPAYPTLRGRPLPADFFADLILGVEERGLPERADWLVTGYISSPEVAALVADFTARAKRANPSLRYLCDPVIGDEGPGRYVPEATAAIIARDLLPLADAATPNAFEVAYLSGHPFRAAADLAAAARAMGLATGARLVATGCVLADTPAGAIETLVQGPEGLARHPTAFQNARLNGTGDLFSGLLVTALACGLGFGEAVSWAQAQMSRAISDAIARGAREASLADPAFRRALLDLGARREAAAAKTPAEMEPSK